MSAVSVCLERLKFLDFFKFEGRPRFIGGPQRSTTGVVGSLLLLAIFLAYMISSSIRFFTTPPATTVLQSPTMDEAHQMMPTCFRIQHINDKRYFGFTLRSIQLDKGGFKVADGETDIPVYDAGNDTVCISPTANNSILQNNCQPGNCRFIKFKLWLACTDDDKNPAQHGDSNGQCAPFAEQVTLLLKNYVDVIYKTPTGGEVILHAAPKVNASAYYESKFAVNETRSAPDMVRWWTENILYELQFVNNRYAVQYFYGATPFAEVMELQMLMDSHRFVTVQSRMTSLDLIGSFGAFWGVISGALGVVFLTYNEGKFYEKNPAWDRIDEAFNVEHGSAKAVMTEGMALIEKKQAALPSTAATYGVLA